MLRFMNKFRSALHFVWKHHRSTHSTAVEGSGTCPARSYSLGCVKHLLIIFFLNGHWSCFTEEIHLLVVLPIFSYAKPYVCQWTTDANDWARCGLSRKHKRFAKIVRAQSESFQFAFVERARSFHAIVTKIVYTFTPKSESYVIRFP